MELPQPSSEDLLSDVSPTLLMIGPKLGTPPAWTLWVRLVWLFLMLNGFALYKWWKERRRQKRMEKVTHLLELYRFMETKGVKMPHLLEQAAKLHDEHIEDLEGD